MIKISNNYYTKAYQSLAKVLFKLQNQNVIKDWMMHAGGALYFYGFEECDMDDIDIVATFDSVSELEEMLKATKEVGSINIKYGRKFSSGIYNGTCIEFMICGVLVHVFNPLQVTTTIRNRDYKYSYDMMSFSNKIQVPFHDTFINLAPLEDVFIYKLILMRSSHDNKRDKEQLVEILAKAKDLNLEYIKEVAHKNELQENLHAIKEFVHYVDHIGANDIQVLEPLFSIIQAHIDNIRLKLFYLTT